MSEIINNDELILQSTSRNHRFSCYEVDKNGSVVLRDGIPKKIYIVFRQKQYRTKDPVKLRSILAYMKHWTTTIEKDGRTVESCPLKFRRFSEAELLKLQEPEAVVMQDTEGNDIKVSMDELKKNYLLSKEKEVPKEKGEVVVRGTRTSQNSNLKQN